jgi:peptide/nickel transport system ATP-binding protein
MKEYKLDVSDLSISYGNKKALSSVNFTLGRGEVLGIIGQSGSGKSTLAHSIIRLLPKNTILSGKITIDSLSIGDLDELQLEREVRGKRCGIIFQSPAACFNPSMKLIHHFREALEKRTKDKEEINAIIADSLKKVNLDSQILDQYVHSISGGMAQRAMIALNILHSPSFLIADEPTTALDTINEANIIRLLKELSVRDKLGILLISHNIELIKAVSKRIIVLYKGDVMEVNESDKLGVHPYTKHLLEMNQLLKGGKARVPAHTHSSKSEKTGCKYTDQCIYEIEKCSEKKPELVDNTRCIIPDSLRVTKESKLLKNNRREYDSSDKEKLLEIDIKAVTLSGKRILRGINFTLHKGEIIAVVGVSGSGKTTLINTILSLNKYDGSIRYFGRGPIPTIFQDPNKALNPRLSVVKSLKEAMILRGSVDTELLNKILQKLSLPDIDALSGLYPRNLSGGEKQRILIAKALSVNADLIVADEPTSMLDPTTKVDFIKTLKNTNVIEQTSYIYITHDMQIALSLSDKILVIDGGRAVEFFKTTEKPESEYAKELMANIL